MAQYSHIAKLGKRQSFSPSCTKLIHPFRTFVHVLWACGISIFHDSDLKDLPRHAMWDLSLCAPSPGSADTAGLLGTLGVALEKLKPGRLEGK